MKSMASLIAAASAQLLERNGYEEWTGGHLSCFRKLWDNDAHWECIVYISSDFQKWGLLLAKNDETLFQKEFISLADGMKAINKVYSLHHV